MTIQDRIEALEQRVDVLESRLTGVSGDKPPEPPKRGDKRDKRHLRVRIDQQLFDSLECDAVANHGGNLSRALTSILWGYYGKPRLSFEGESNGDK